MWLCVDICNQALPWTAVIALMVATYLHCALCIRALCICVAMLRHHVLRNVSPPCSWPRDRGKKVCNNSGLEKRACAPRPPQLSGGASCHLYRPRLPVQCLFCNCDEGVSVSLPSPNPNITSTVAEENPHVCLKIVFAAYVNLICIYCIICKAVSTFSPCRFSSPTTRWIF